MKLKLLRLWCFIRGFHKWNMWGGVITKSGRQLMVPIDGTRCCTCKQYYVGKLKEDHEKKVRLSGL